jgi:hypothetical protein
MTFQEIEMREVFAPIFLALSAFVAPAFAQNPQGMFNLFGGLMQSAVGQATEKEWRKIPQNELTCIDQSLRARGSSVQYFIQRGIAPANAPIAADRASCQRQIAATGNQTTAVATPVASEQNTSAEKYVIQGVRLGDDITQSANYTNFNCSPSDLFQSFTWCIWRQEGTDANGKFLSTTSALHSADGRVYYMSRTIEPAVFGPNDINREIDRLSKGYRQQPKVLMMPPKAGLPSGVIVSWGDVVLQPLDATSIQLLAAGKSPAKGYLIDFLGDLNRSAQQGSPIYLLTGGAGMLWNATYDASGRGSLRLAFIDASQFMPSSSSAQVVTQAPAPAGPAFDPSQFGGNISVVGGSPEPAAPQPAYPPNPIRVTSPPPPSNPSMAQSGQPFSVPTGQPVLPSAQPSPTSQTALQTPITLPSPSTQPGSTTQTVVAQGLGKDVESAAKNAAENALMQVVGSFVQSDKMLNRRTEISNGIRQESSSIDSNIREYSQGSIKSFDLLDTSQDGGLVRVTARVEVRIEDFKAFVQKLAEGQTSVGPGIFAQVATQTERKQNAQDIVTNNILLPLLEGKATEFTLGTPQIYSEWAGSQNPSIVNSVNQLMRNYNAPRESIVIPVKVDLNASFLQNTTQALESIAFAKKGFDNGRDPGVVCYDKPPDGFDNRLDGALAIATPSSLLDVYFVKDIQNIRPQSLSSVTSLTNLIQGFASYRDNFIYNYNSSFAPDLSVTLFGADEDVAEYLIRINPGARFHASAHSARIDSSASSDKKVFVDKGWIGMAGGYDACPVIIPSFTMNLFMNLDPQTLQKVKSIDIKLVPR